MYLVMVKEKPNGIVEKMATEMINMSYSKQSYHGESLNRIRENLDKEDSDCVIVTADSRFLKLVPAKFHLHNVYILDGRRLVNLQEATKRNLKDGHDLMKLFEAGEFDCSIAPASSLY